MELEEIVRSISRIADVNRKLHRKLHPIPEAFRGRFEIRDALSRGEYLAMQLSCRADRRYFGHLDINTSHTVLLCSLKYRDADGIDATGEKMRLLCLHSPITFICTGSATSV